LLRDDILNAAIARQARMQHAYEDRIAALRSQVDRITSYSLLDQQIMETKVAELLTRQSALLNRNSRMAPLLEQATTSGIAPVEDKLDPSAFPFRLPREAAAKTRRTLFEPQEPIRASLDQPTIEQTADNGEGEMPPIVALSQFGVSLKDLESDQISQISALASSARAMRRQIVADARKAGLPLKAPAAGRKVPADRSFPPRPMPARNPSTRNWTLNRELEALDRGPRRDPFLSDRQSGARPPDHQRLRQPPRSDHRQARLSIPVSTFP
jgi:hypothetical protein